MLSAHEKELLKDEFHVQVFADGRVDWDRLDVFLKRNGTARRELVSHLEDTAAHPRRHGRLH